MDVGPLTSLGDVKAYSAYMRHWTETQAGSRAVVPLFGVTFEQATAALSALSCPTYHANTVPVELVATGERVAVLCLDCDTQLPAEWEPVKPSYTDLFYDPKLTTEVRR